MEAKVEDSSFVPSLANPVEIQDMEAKSSSKSSLANQGPTVEIQEMSMEAQTRRAIVSRDNWYSGQSTSFINPTVHSYCLHIPIGFYNLAIMAILTSYCHTFEVSTLDMF